jgi:hypothetical protein
MSVFTHHYYIDTEKRRKVDEIAKKYEKKPKSKKRVTRGYSYQEQDKSMLNKFGDKKMSNHGGKKHPGSDLDQVGIKSSKITAQKREGFKEKKHSQVVSNKLNFESKRKAEDDQTDEKLKSQTFRFTNQFKSDDGDGTYFDNEDEYINDEFIEEEIDTESNHSPPKNNKKMQQLVKKSGPVDVPSDTNLFVKKRVSIEDPSDMMGTPVCKPPKVPPRVNMKNVFKSPVSNIFKPNNKNTSGSNTRDTRNSEPVKPLKGVFGTGMEDDNILGYDISHDEESNTQEINHQKSMAERAFTKVRKDFTMNKLRNRSFSPPFVNDQA